MILSVGRWWDEGKNGRVLDEAAPHAPWPIILAGALHGPNGASSQFAHLETTGALPPPEIRTLMQRAAIFAAPSLYEPFGLAVAEAATAGAALVLSDIPTFRELWHGAALFVPPDQPQAWAQAFHSLANDVTLRQRLSATAKHRVATFTLGRQAEEIHAVYRSLKTAAAA
ncbi:MAG: glycosyltransferase family 4 protein [Proteobacteria bacterium]|nr:glycosyltransferase family 4 protein [Pseudomonadota bacterium]